MTKKPRQSKTVKTFSIPLSVFALLLFSSSVVQAQEPVRLLTLSDTTEFSYYGYRPGVLNRYYTDRTARFDGYTRKLNLLNGVVDEVRFYVHDPIDPRKCVWFLQFSTAGLEKPLLPGVYTDTKLTDERGYPRLTAAKGCVSYPPAVCTWTGGKFIVHEAEYDYEHPDGDREPTLLRFSAEFELYCGSRKDALLGRLYYNVPVKESEPRPEIRKVTYEDGKLVVRAKHIDRKGTLIIDGKFIQLTFDNNGEIFPDRVRVKLNLPPGRHDIQLVKLDGTHSVPFPLVVPPAASP